MENQSMTVQQVLMICVDQLNSIPVPIGMMESIGNPIKGVLQNLNVCIEAMNISKEEPEDGREADTE